MPATQSPAAQTPGALVRNAASVDDTGCVVDHAGGLQTEVFHLRSATSGNQDLVRLDLEAGALKVTMSGDALAVARRRDALQGYAGFDAYSLLHQELAQDVDQLGLLEWQEPRIPAQHRNLDPEAGEDLSKLHGDRAAADDGQ